MGMKTPISMPYRPLPTQPAPRRAHAPTCCNAANLMPLSEVAKADGMSGTIGVSDQVRQVWRAQKSGGLPRAILCRPVEDSGARADLSTHSTADDREC